MCAGAFFRPVDAKGRVDDRRRFFVILAKSHKTLHWNDPAEGGIPK